MRMNLVLETNNLQSAIWEKEDWLRMGYKVTIKEARKVFKGGFQLVYRVWVKPTESTTNSKVVNNRKEHSSGK